MAAFTWPSSACASAVVALVACGANHHAAPAGTSASRRPGWAARVDIAIKLPNASVLTEFPVPLRLTRERVDFARIASDGHDLRFTDSNGVDVPFEIERFDARKVTWVWVRLPRVEPGRDTRLMMYFDNPKAPYLEPSEARTVWGAELAGVYHLDDTIDDSSPAQSATSGTGMSPADGIVGPAHYFAGKPIDDITSTTAALPSAQHAICAWANTDQIGAGRSVMLAGYATFALLRQGADARCGSAAAANAFAIGTWRQVCCVHAGNVDQIYVDGVPAAKAPAAHEDAGGTLHIGGGSWIGVIDEVRVSRVAPSADWIATDHAAMTTDVATFGAVVAQ
jgi:hypothetical protein